LRELIGQQLIIGLSGPQLTTEEADFIIRHNIGGVILMKRNCQSPQQIHELTSRLQELRHKTADQAPLFIGIDMEGGRVARLTAPFTIWPPIAALGRTNSTSAAFKLAQFMGNELRAVGVNLDFAPCIDVFSNPKNQVIGDRSPGSDPELVGRIGSALVRGYIKAEVIPCAKHFPGHGNTLLDSHEDLPTEHKTREELEACELIPFKKVFRSRLDLVMTSHIRFEALDPQWPVTLSQKIISELLRGDLKYRNLIVTDDLDMKALTKNFDKKQIPVRALQAGANLLLYCNEPESHRMAVEAIEQALKDKTLDAQIVSTNHRRILELKRSKLTNVTPLPFEQVGRIVGHPDHARLAKAILAGDVPEDLLQT